MNIVDCVGRRKEKMGERGRGQQPDNERDQAATQNVGFNACSSKTVDDATTSDEQQQQ